MVGFWHFQIYPFFLVFFGGGLDKFIMIGKNRVSFRTILTSANDEFSTHDFSKPTFPRYRLWGTNSLFRGRCQEVMKRDGEGKEARNYHCGLSCWEPLRNWRKCASSWSSSAVSSWWLVESCWLPVGVKYAAAATGLHGTGLYDLSPHAVRDCWPPPTGL